MGTKTFLLSFLILLFFASCNNNTIAGDKKDTANEEPATSSSGNHLSMKINGVEWRADNEITGSFHPEGYNKAIIIAGSKGVNNKDEQAFTINLYNTNGPGVFDIKDGNTDKNVVQLTNVSPEHFMYGSMMGFSMKVTVTKASSNPTVVEASFEGELTGNASDKIKITDGKFYYHE